ncbi:MULTISPECIES: hypothetical protein [Actinosynnema]|uniref:hypothetical protein n=1 Tax=Actinosynnema TaxID=40566 RepID=UPI0020A33E46|nr:hypothetical protein [Actinosynnema pretiosum]MCP2093645.1 hypothetical protein [Actinosynnema pretiosum]
MGVYRSKRTRNKVLLISALPMTFGLLGLIQPWTDEWVGSESLYYAGALNFALGVALCAIGLFSRVELTAMGFVLHSSTGHKHELARQDVAEIWHVDWKPSFIYVRDHWGRVFTVRTSVHDVEYARHLVQVMRDHQRQGQPEMPPARSGSHPGSVPAMRPVSHPGSVPAMRPVAHPGSVPSMQPVSHPGSIPAMRPVSHPGSVPSMRPVAHPGLPSPTPPANQAPAPEGRATGSAPSPAQPTT